MGTDDYWIRDPVVGHLMRPDDGACRQLFECFLIEMALLGGGKQIFLQIYSIGSRETDSRTGPVTSHLKRQTRV